MREYYKTDSGVLYQGDVLEVLKSLPDESIDCVITSPPYWALRDYGVDGQLGLEPTFQEYLEKLWQIFDEIYRVLNPTGTCWVNLGDTYGQNWRGSNKQNEWHRLKRSKGEVDFMGKKKPNRGGIPDKCLLQIPARFSIGMIERGWILRNEIIWHKPNAMPSSVKDRFTVDFEKIFFFVKRKKYYFKQQLEQLKHTNASGMRFGGNAAKQYGNAVYSGRVYDASKLSGRNKRTVWTISTKPFKDAHFAVFPPDIPEICIKAGCPENGTVLDPFMGSGTTAVVTEQSNRKWIGIELNPEYCEIAKKRIESVVKEKKMYLF